MTLQIHIAELAADPASLEYWQARDPDHIAVAMASRPGREAIEPGVIVECGAPVKVARVVEYLALASSTPETWKGDRSRTKAAKRRTMARKAARKLKHTNRKATR